MRNSKILRGICYILLPILVGVMILSIFYAVLTNEDKFTSKEAFFQSDSFRINYMYNIVDLMDELIYAQEDAYSTIKDGEKTIYFSKKDIELYDLKDFSKFLIIYENKVLTNVRLNTVEEIKADILESNQNYIQYENNNITSNIANFVEDNYSYNILNSVRINYYKTGETELSLNDVEEQIYAIEEEIRVPTETFEQDEEPQYYTVTGGDFTFYTSYIPEFDEDSEYNLIFQIVEKLAPYQSYIIFSIPIVSILILIILVYLINSIGYEKGKDGIQLSDFDKLPLEVILLVVFSIFGVSLVILSELSYSVFKLNVFSMIIFSLYIVNFYLLETAGVTIVRRVKAKQFINTSWCGRICKWAINVIKKIWKKTKEVLKNIRKSLNENTSLVWKLVIIIVGYAIFSVIMVGIFNIFGFAISLGLFGYALYQVIQKINSFTRLEKGLQNIYEGKTKVRLNVDDFSPEFAKAVEYVNDISNGFENAVNESLKSERLKTELITNVSHDIKTPLTSIINYVDLLKTENIENEKAKEYIGILDNKSQRLKKLIEDLVEASKASSGNIKLNLEKINILELIKQAMGEFEDRFAEKKLDIISELPKNNVEVKADSRHMYRVIENLFSNISKYALEGSRVYIDVKTIDKKVKIEIKNISKERLNITEEELMQRFVRGDKARTTEGNGLGLAIARSLIQIQEGSLNCIIDGDLFKVEIELDIVN